MANIFQTALSTLIAKIEKPHKYGAIRVYARRIGRLLQAKYGKQETYTPVQVKTTIVEWGYSTNYDCFGLAMYCNDLDFTEYHRAIGESCNYAAMRGEIGNCLFGANVDFSPSSLIATDFSFDATGHHHHGSSNSYVDSDRFHNYGGSAHTGHTSHDDCGGHAGGDFGGGCD